MLKSSGPVPEPQRETPAHPLSALTNAAGRSLLKGIVDRERKQDDGHEGTFLALVAATGLWSLATGKSDSAASARQHFPLPEKLYVVDTDLPTHNEDHTITDKGKERTITVRYIKPHEVDFDDDFYLKTNRYTIIKDDDFIGTRWLGHLASIPTKIFFWDARAGWGLSEDGTKNVLGMLERDTTVSGLTVRINHNEVFEDTIRAFTDERAKERNNFVARALYGVPETLLGEFFSELRRGDYYNPMTGTMVLYSDIPAIYAHEAGHHKDFARFDSDWIYSMTGYIPGVCLYQEAKASFGAKDELLPEPLQWQAKRYLIPAYATYVLYSAWAFARIFSKRFE